MPSDDPIDLTEQIRAEIMSLIRDTEALAEDVRARDPKAATAIEGILGHLQAALREENAAIVHIEAARVLRADDA